ncbi:hypothetical protein ASPBRDRAFT_316585 [Aspergillus brasiliensis CBS 101740]|uniref:Uncharacterized protein n=1 Tax=Aspergillus brasiliensis (strain CBS 101740 / IMI 381727 / IBT 21946) TaxID=767769 RepID=A0A1L9U8U3_ASPBC|nr:hypothetical protein ASPBRDRAFT_316585 [Aspergillus brasiliensis CBS 101740]
MRGRAGTTDNPARIRCQESRSQQVQRKVEEAVEGRAYGRAHEAPGRGPQQKNSEALRGLAEGVRGCDYTDAYAEDQASALPLQDQGAGKRPVQLRGGVSNP